MKKIVSLVLVLALVLSMGLFAANAEGADREVVNLTMLSEPANDAGLQENNWMANYLMNELQITVELIPNADGKLQALLAADSLPDIVIINTGVDKIKNAVESGQLVALSDYAEQLPHAYEYLPTAINYYSNNLDNGDGKCYMLSNGVGAVAGGYSLNYSASLRWDLYAKLGYPEIADAWDYLDVLKAMQDLEPVNEDGQKVYGISLFNSWDSTCMSCSRYSPITSQSGHNSEAFPFNDVDEATGEILDAFAEDSLIIKTLKWYWTANQMGIFDPDSITQTWNAWIEKMTAGRILFGFWDWGGGYYNTADRTEAEDPKGFCVVLPTNTKVRMETENPLGSHWSWGIGHNTQYLDRCLEYVDFMCNPDKIFILENGPKGETWDLNEDGKPYVTEIGKQAAADSSYTLAEGGRMFNGTALINSVPISTAITSPEYNSPISQSMWETYAPEYTKIQKQWQEYYGYDKIIDKLVAEGTWTKGMKLESSLLAPPSDDIQQMINAIGTDIVQPMEWKAVYAETEEEFNSIIAQMIDDAKALGLEDVQADAAQRWADACAAAAELRK